MPSPALIHSDLSRTHVFVAPGPGGEMRLAGVIDLEFGRFADPLSEHLITGFEWGNAPIEMRPAFVHGYGMGGFFPKRGHPHPPLRRAVARLVCAAAGVPGATVWRCDV